MVYKAHWSDWKEGHELGFFHLLEDAQKACQKHADNANRQSIPIEWKEHDNSYSGQANNQPYVIYKVKVQ